MSVGSAVVNPLGTVESSQSDILPVLGPVVRPVDWTYSLDSCRSDDPCCRSRGIPSLCPSSDQLGFCAWTCDAWSQSLSCAQRHGLDVHDGDHPCDRRIVDHCPVAFCTVVVGVDDGGDRHPSVGDDDACPACPISCGAASSSSWQLGTHHSRLEPALHPL